MPSGRRVSRVAAAFAGALPDLVEESVLSKERIVEAWQAFCTEQGEPTGGATSAVYLLVRWRVLVRAGWNRFRLAGRTQVNFRRRAPADREGALEGERPPLLAGEFASPVPRYDMPAEFLRLSSLDVYAMQRAARSLLCEDRHLVPKQITQQNFKEYQHAVLFAEELQMKYDMSLYDLEVTDRLDFRGGLHTVFVPGLAEKRPSVLRGDGVLLTCKQGRFLGYTHDVLLDKIKVSFHNSFQNRPPFTIKFTFNRTPLRTMHRAIDELACSLIGTGGIPQSRVEPHPDLNEKQRKFLGAALQLASCRNEPPLLLWGPPGTGKTTTLVHTIAAILRKQPSAKVLVTAPSNPASDLICEKLAQNGVRSSEMLRLVALMRDSRHVAPSVLRFTRTDTVTGCFKVPDLGELQEQRVIVATCTTAAYIRSRMARPLDCWFTHVFVDEAAQAMEPEVLVPLTLRRPYGRVFLVGDFKQLGPVIRSPIAIEFGLSVPLMERAVQALGVVHSRIVALTDTYRAHPSILRLYNKTVYAGMLSCCSPTASYDMEGWPECSEDRAGVKHPVIFHHCDGQESRTRGSPSWQNVDEGNLVKQYLMKLLAHGVEAEDIGIISPYHQQCQRLRYICQGEGVDVEVGTTELFQGREKRVIIISTVRSRQQEAVTSDFRFALGFLGNFKRTNVAVSRARSLLIVVGNMALLSNDATWNNIVKLVRDMRGLRGESFRLSRPIYGENSEWVGNAASLTGMEGSFDGAADRPWRDPM